MDHGILSDIELPISSVNLNQINNNSFNLTQGYHPLTTSAGLSAVGVAQQQPQQQQQQQQQQHNSSILGGSDHYGNPMALGGNNNNNTLLSAAGGLVDNSCLFSTGSTTIDYGGSPLQELPDTKEGIEELCPVCGDKVSGYHYGLLTCESCKGFFKRTVQNKKVYTCVADRSCQIDKAQRKRCPFCRFQKCLEVGMKLEAVRADRMRGGRNKFGPMYKRDRARKMQIMRQRTLPSSPRGLSIVGNEAVTVSYPNLNTTHSVSYGSGNVTIKQEIQYPVLSSTSTSSPDSSPSPINPPVTSMAAVSPHLNGTLQAQGGLVSPDPNLWSSSPGTPSPPSSRISPLLTNGGSPGTVGGTGVMTTPTGMTKIPLLIREFVQTLDDREWQNALFGLLQNQTYNQCEVDLFELMCKVLDQNLFAQVDWARNSIFFKDLKVDDQMKLLQQSWSDMLILDHVHHRLHNNLPDDTTLPNGQKFSLLSLALLGMTQHVQDFNDITAKLQELKFDLSDFVCLKFILLLNPDVKTLVNRKHVQTAHDQVQQAMLEYCVNVYPQMPDKYSRLMALMPEIHSLSARGEEYLYYKHVNGNAPTQTLLMEMLHAKKKQ